MDHVTFHEFVEARLGSRIWQFGRHEPVDLGRRAGFIGFGEDEQEVDMREASFLEFDDPGVRSDLAEYVGVREQA